MSISELRLGAKQQIQDAIDFFDDQHDLARVRSCDERLIPVGDFPIRRVDADLNDGEEQTSLVSDFVVGDFPPRQVAERKLLGKQ